MNIIINDFVGDAAFTGFGEAAPVQKDFNWSTDLVSFDSGLEQRNQIFQQPLREWPINWPWLDLAARNKLIELFQRAKGLYDTFLFRDSDDYECALSECNITAVAAQVLFQLKKSYYVGESETWDEDKKDIVPGGTFQPIIKVDAVTKTEDTDYTLDDTTGIVDFTLMGAPGAGAVVTANYQFYFRVRFELDTYTDVLHTPDYYRAKNLRLIEVKS
jgi:uncharacterized protein (TIGR02217 family)